MKIYKTYEQASGWLNKPVLTIGDFDGVHLGHQKILKKVIERSKAINGEAVVLTFSPNTKHLTNSANNGTYLTSTEDKLAIFEKMGINSVIIENFTENFRDIKRKSFVYKILVKALNVKELVVGEGFKFGKNREGNEEYLFNSFYGEFRFIFVKPVRMGNKTISSTYIKECIQKSNFDEAKKCLGRSYKISGNVIAGNKMGGKLGFPTANIYSDAYVLPDNGVYTGIAKFEDKLYKTCLNIGMRPTFDDHSMYFEAHLVDFHKDIYGENLEVFFVEKIRDIKKFDSADQLSAQIKDDVLNSINILDNSKIEVDLTL